MTKQVPFRYDLTIFFALTDVLFTFLQAVTSRLFQNQVFVTCWDLARVFFLTSLYSSYFFLLFVMILVEVGDEDWLSAKNGAQYTLGHRTDLEANRAGGFLQKESNLLSPNTNWVAAPHNIGRAGR